MIEVTESDGTIRVNMGDGWSYPFTEEEAENLATTLRNILDERYKDRWQEQLTRRS